MTKVVKKGSLPKEDLTGRQLGGWKVLKYLGRDKWRKAIWLCQCSKCGIQEERIGTSIKGKKESKECRNCYEEHNGVRYDTTYIVWQMIKQRCYNLKNDRYDRYGGRGISMYKPWINNYESFRQYVEEEINEKQEGWTLDRIDNDGNYEPGNLRWASQKTQVRNRKITKLDVNTVAAIRGHRLKNPKTTARQIADKLNLNLNTIYGVLNYNRWEEVQPSLSDHLILNVTI